ncbi:MAG: sigma-54-dependent Fis family transcriptional regulator [Proteobacteria bacterium]|nr:sigma-54-dependent Fis family transcriptional regulator [Pseudomonadota bacterium]
MIATEISSSFSRPEHNPGVRDSWQRFVQGEGTSADVLRFQVEDSWRRCVGAKVDPGISQAPHPMGVLHVTELLELHRDLIEACKPVMTMASDFLSETGTVMVLTDPRGVVLGVEGDGNALGPAERIHLLPGASWSESECGTNAIGTALALGNQVQIHSEEHFCEGIKRWTCSAAVIRGPLLGEILGVIDVSGLSRSYSRHALLLVVTAANRIEAFLAKREWQTRCLLIERTIARLSTPDGAGAIIVDRHGFPIKLNENAPALLASLGALLDMNKPSSIAGLSDAGAETVTSPDALPSWLRQEWIEPIFEDGQRVGSVVRVPPHHQKSKAQSAVIAPPESSSAVAFAGAKGSSVEIQKAIEKARLLAPSRVPILLLGETGVGKEVFARGIHASSRGRDGPFVALNCGGLSRDLLATELFGHVDGAYTGARRGGMPGKIEAADGGTLFLDELGEMPLDLQPHFLRVLEDGQICRLGDTNPRHVRFRLIAATNRDLRQDVTEGRFRMDLFYRVSVTNVRIPALRERTGDIAELASSFVRQLCKLHEVPLKVIDPVALKYMESYSWLGNVRELKNMIESLVITVSGDVIGPEDLPPEILATSPEMADPADRTDGESLSVLARSEFEQICKVLRRTSGNATLAAKELGIAKSTLYLKLKKYSLDESLDSWRSGHDLRG